MRNGNTDNLIVLTGPPGSGRTSLLAVLRALGVCCVDESARRVIAEQRRVGGRGTSEQDPTLFADLMLGCAVDDYERYCGANSPVIFDRGIPDLLAYASHFELNDVSIRAACGKMPYSREVLYAPAWEAIYATDEERTMTFEATVQFGESIRRGYRDYGYTLVDLPLSSIWDRAAFVVALLKGD